MTSVANIEDGDAPIRWRYIGFARVMFKSGGEVRLFRLEEFEAIWSAWSQGQTFYRGLGIYGQTICIRLSDVAAVEQATPDAFALEDADNAEDHAERVARGEDV